MPSATGSDAAEITIQEDLLIPVCDDTVSATRYSPVESSEPLPALLMYEPYHKDGYITFGAYDPMLRYFALHGYEVIAADMVGTGASSGSIDEMFPQREGKEGAALVSWLADQEWTNGRVGMFGKSYGGITALYTAAERPDALEAIVPIHTPYTGYRNGYLSEGLLEYFTISGSWLGLMQVLDVKPPGRRDADGRWADVWKQRLETVADRDPWLFQFLDHETKDEYWQDKDIDVENITTPTFAVGGYRDGYAHETIEYFDAITGPKRLLFGPWRHTIPHRGLEVATDFRREAIEWFDYFLKDEANGALDHPTVTYWTELDGGGKENQGVWRGREEWPEVGAIPADETLSFAATPDGFRPDAQFETGEVVAEYEYDQTVGIDSFDLGHPLDTSADDTCSLTFDSTPLDDPVELSGTGVATVRLSSTTPDPNVVVRVVDVSPDGTATLVTHGQLRASHRNGSAKEQLSPDEEYTLSIPLKPKSHVFEAGHRIRFALSAAFFPMIRPARRQGAFTVRSTPDAQTGITFPGTERESVEFPTAFELNPPDTTVPTTTQFVSNKRSSWETSRERVSNAATVRTNNAKTIELDDVTITSEKTVTASVSADTPEETGVHTTTELTMEYGYETVRVDADSRVTLDGAQLETVVSVEDEVVFEKRWMR